MKNNRNPVDEEGTSEPRREEEWSKLGEGMGVSSVSGYGGSGRLNRVRKCFGPKMSSKSGERGDWDCSRAN